MAACDARDKRRVARRLPRRRVRATGADRGVRRRHERGDQPGDDPPARLPALGQSRAPALPHRRLRHRQEPPARHRAAEAGYDHRHDLGQQIAEQQPAWAIEALGRFPADEEQRDRWLQRAGVAAAHHELYANTAGRRSLGSTIGVDVGVGLDAPLASAAHRAQRCRELSVAIRRPRFRRHRRHCRS